MGQKSRVVAAAATMVSSAMVLSCGGPSDDSDAVGAITSALTTVKANMRSFTRSDGKEVILSHLSDNTIGQWVGPPASRTFTNLGGSVTRSAVGIKRVDNVDAVYYVGSDGHIHEIASGTNTDLFVTVSAPLAVVADSSGSELVAYNRVDGHTSLFYARASDRHIIELLSNFSGSPSWLTTDLTAVSSGKIPMVNSLMAYRRSDSTDAIVYIGGGLRVCELRRNPSGSPAWVFTDLMTASGFAPGDAFTVSGYQRSDGKNAVLFTGSHMIYELTMTPGQFCSGTKEWCVSASLAAGLLANNQRPYGYVRWDGLSSIVFLGDGFIGEFIRSAAGAWSQESIVAWGEFMSLPFPLKAPGAMNSIVVSEFVNGQGTVAEEFSQVNGSTTWTKNSL